MDFEFALWQMLYLFVSPQKVYRNFNYRKRKHHAGKNRNLTQTFNRNSSPFFQRQSPNSRETILRFWFF